MIAIDLYTFVMRELSALSDIFKSIPMNLFRTSSHGNLLTFVLVAWCGNYVFRALKERWQ